MKIKKNGKIITLTEEDLSKILKGILNENIVNITPNEDDEIELECFKISPEGKMGNKVEIKGKAVQGLTNLPIGDQKNVPNIKVISTYGMDGILSGQEKSDGVYVEAITDNDLKHILDLGDNKKVITHFNKNMINSPTKRHYCSVINITDNLKKEFRSVGVNIV